MDIELVLYPNTNAAPHSNWRFRPPVSRAGGQEREGLSAPSELTGKGEGNYWGRIYCVRSASTALLLEKMKPWVSLS